MEILHFNDYEDLVCSISDALDTLGDLDDYVNLSVIAKYDDAKEIITELIFNGYEPISVNLNSKDANGYDDEYVITAVNNDGEYEVWYQEFKRNGKYMDDFSSVTYIFDDCSSMCIPHLLGKCVFEVGIGECDCDEYQCTCKGETDGELATLSTYFVNGEPVDKSVFEKYDKELRARMKLIEDEMNAFRRLFCW